MDSNFLYPFTANIKAYNSANLSEDSLLDGLRTRWWVSSQEKGHESIRSII